MLPPSPNEGEHCVTSQKLAAKETTFTSPFNSNQFEFLEQVAGSLHLHCRPVAGTKFNLVPATRFSPDVEMGSSHEETWTPGLVILGTYPLMHADLDLH